MQELPDCQPEITYPTRWGYRLIGTDEAAVRAAVTDVIANRDHTFAASHQSTAGRYLSFALELEVQDEADRHGLFNAFAAHDAIVYVL